MFRHGGGAREGRHLCKYLIFIKILSTKINRQLNSGLIRVLHKQVGSKGKVHVNTLKSKWRGLSLNLSDLDQILTAGGWHDLIEWPKFLALTSTGVAHDGGIPIGK